MHRCADFQFFSLNFWKYDQSKVKRKFPKKEKKWSDKMKSKYLLINFLLAKVSSVSCKSTVSINLFNQLILLTFLFKFLFDKHFYFVFSRINLITSSESFLSLDISISSFWPTSSMTLNRKKFDCCIFYLKAAVCLSILMNSWISH